MRKDRPVSRCWLRTVHPVMMVRPASLVLPVSLVHKDRKVSQHFLKPILAIRAIRDRKVCPA